MEIFPVGLRLAGCPVLVVGGGSVALRKIRRLLRAGARVVMVSPAARPELRRLAMARKMVWLRRPFAKSVLDTSAARLVFACTGSEETNQQVGLAASRAFLWVNRADSPADSTAHVPAVARLGPHLRLAIFSDGRAPVFVKYVRKRLEKVMGMRLAEEMKVLAAFRKRIRERVDGAPRRKRILTRLLEDGTVERLAQKPARLRSAALRRWMEDMT